jgi:hypothetical protein
MTTGRINQISGVHARCELDWTACGLAWISGGQGKATYPLLHTRARDSIAVIPSNASVALTSRAASQALLLDPIDYDDHHHKTGKGEHFT